LCPGPVPGGGALVGACGLGDVVEQAAQVVDGGGEVDLAGDVGGAAGEEAADTENFLQNAENGFDDGASAAVGGATLGGSEAVVHRFAGGRAGGRWALGRVGGRDAFMITSFRVGDECGVAEGFEVGVAVVAGVVLLQADGG